MNAFTINSSYWSSSGVTGQQWVMYNYPVHNTTSLSFGIKIRTTSTTNGAILFSKDGTTTREFNLITSNGGTELTITLFKSNLTRILTTIPNSLNYNNGYWHTIEANYNSNGAGSGGVLNIIFDGITTSHILPTIDSIQQGNHNICLNGRDGGTYPIAFDCEHVTLGSRKWNFSALYSTLVYDEAGGKYFQSVNQTLSNVWKLSTDSFIRPSNMIDGGRRYTNGTPSQDVILSKELEKFRYNSSGLGSGLNTTEIKNWTITLKSEYFAISKTVNFRFFIKTVSPFNGYNVYISQTSSSAGRLTLTRYTNGSGTNITSSTPFYFTMGEDIVISISRSSSGLFEVKNGSTLVLSKTDTTHTESIASQVYNQRGYIVSCYAGSEPFTLSNYIWAYLGLPTYTSHTRVLPLSFSDFETKFYLPFNQQVKDRDVNEVLYDHSTDVPLEISYDVLVNEDFGAKITYKDNGDDSFSNFLVRK
jgi:hypothetical protein